LEALVTAQELEALAALEARAEAALEQQQDAAAAADGADDYGNSLTSARVVLPLPWDKEGRARLHTAVRARFPCLRTGTAQEEEEAAASGRRLQLRLVVQCDAADMGKLRALRALLPDPAQALALYAYVAR